ncbi:MAG: fibronectin type III domain-containing protein [Nocardioidaceae bacterium]
MRTISRALTAALAVAALATPVLTASPASADPKPGEGQEWPLCGEGGDTDGFYCVVSVTRDGVPVTSEPDLSVDGSYEDPYIDLIGPGDVRFGIDHWVVTGGVPDIIGTIEPDVTWEWTVNTGPVDPVEMYGHLRDPQLSFGGNATDGYTFTLSVKPAPIAWNWDASGWLPCDFPDACGDDTTVAGLVYDGFITGYVTDDAAWTPASEVAHRRGYINSYNAQNASWFYDSATNSMVVQMANVHLKAPGVPATGYFETVIPDAMLIHEYSVPDPDNLTTGSFQVRQSGTTATVPFTVTRLPGAVRLEIEGITFSTPEFRIKPKASVPGKPRWGSVTRPKRTTVKVTFKRPLADGGKAITGYRVQCGRGDAVWTTGVRRVAPVTFPDMPRKLVDCRVRARNAKGLGPWSTVKQG